MPVSASSQAANAIGDRSAGGNEPAWLIAIVFVVIALVVGWVLVKGK